MVRQGLLDHAGWDTDGGRVRRDFRHHHGVGPNKAVVSNGHISQDALAAAYVHPVLDGWDGRAFAAGRDSEVRVMVDLDIITDRTGVAYDPAVMPDPRPPAQSHPD